MKIEVLENNKIKVTLTIDDLIYHNLKPEHFFPESVGLRKFLFTVMENVRRETGFNPYKGTVAVEAVQSHDGMVLYISEIKKRPDSVKSITVRGKEKNIRIYSRKHIKPESKYMFDDFTNLCEAITLVNDDILKASSVYEYENCWYFMLGANDKFEHTHSVMTEFCKNYGSLLASEAFFVEHGKCIAQGPGLVSLAAGLKNLKKKQ